MSSHSTLQILGISILALGLNLSGCGSRHHHKDAAPDSDDRDDLDSEKKEEKPRKESLKPAKEAPKNEVIANFNGALFTQNILQARLAPDDFMFNIGSYIDAPVGRSVFGLSQLLGYQVGTGLQSEFRNGQANPINMILWHVVITGVADGVASNCNLAPESEPSLVLKDSVLAAVKTICTWPASEARSTAALRQLWTLVLAHDAPDSEFEAFRAFFQGDAYASASGADVTAAMITAMLYNPNFLIRK